ncbi:MAG: hypothetical protein KC766_36450 [Myxococcales bacterium]|nr:hypothetical protein [Myxococcales bacterium]
MSNQTGFGWALAGALLCVAPGCGGEAASDQTGVGQAGSSGAAGAAASGGTSGTPGTGGSSGAGVGGAGAGGAPDTGAEDAAIDAAFAGYAEAYCPSVQPCCVEDAHPYDRAGCEAYVEGVVQQLKEQANSQVAAGHHLSKEHLGRCVQDQLAAAKACEAAAPESCRHIWYGDQPLGGECADVSECDLASGLGVRCIHDHEGTKRCFGHENVQAGEPCNWTSERPWPEKGNAFSGLATKDYIERYCVVSEGNTCWGDECVPIAGQPGDECQMFSCVSGNYCAETAECAPRPAQGEACPGFLEDGCASGLFCSADTGGNGMCEAKRADGASCEFAKQCASGLCFMQQCGLKAPSTTTAQCGG